MEFYTDQCLFLYVYVHIEMKVTFGFKQTVWWVHLFQYKPPCTYKYTRWCFALWCMSQSLWTTVILYRCRYISFIVFDGDDADTHLPCKIGRKISWRCLQSSTTLSIFFLSVYLLNVLLEPVTPKLCTYL